MKIEMKRIEDHKLDDDDVAEIEEAKLREMDRF